MPARDSAPVPLFHLHGARQPPDRQSEGAVLRCSAHLQPGQLLLVGLGLQPAPLLIPGMQCAI